MSYLKNDKSNLMITFVAMFICTALLFTYSGCNEDLALNELNEPNTPIYLDDFDPNEQYQEINDAIEDFALIVALYLQDREYREFYKSEAMKKFDGDFDILYSLVKDKFVGGKSLHTRISEIANDIKKSTELNFKTEFRLVDELISKIPKLQIAIPVKCEEWNTSDFIPPVACLSSELEKETVTHVKAYESDGTLILLDKAVTPEHTVLVISINERLDENGNVRDCYLGKP